jgi:hypothetical protein
VFTKSILPLLIIFYKGVEKAYQIYYNSPASTSDKRRVPVNHVLEIMAMVLVALMIIGAMYFLAAKPIIQRRRRLTDIKHGLRKNEYKHYQEFEFDPDKKTIDLRYLDKLDYRFFFDECELGWFIYDRIPATNEWVIVRAVVFNGIVTALLGAIDKYYTDMDYEVQAAHEDLSEERKRRFHLWWRHEQPEGTSA